MSKALVDSLIYPDWPAPTNVKAIQTTRICGVSKGRFSSFNLGAHVKDNPIDVAHNRQLLTKLVPTEPVWLNQVHGTRVIDAALSQCVEQADASFTRQENVVCVTMTADCLPILLCNQAGTVIAAVHAGWRSLCDGVIEQAVHAMSEKPNHLMAWLGPAIGPEAFEVGKEVREQFIAKDAQAETAFQLKDDKDDKWLGNLYQIATQRLNKLGISAIYGGGLCTFSDEAQFFSFRRDGDTGRMGTFIWLTR